MHECAINYDTGISPYRALQFKSRVEVTGHTLKCVILEIRKYNQPTHSTFLALLDLLSLST